MPPLEESSAFDIMLSPQFYTYKHEDMPIRFKFQAKKLAPSILENLLPKDIEYEYFVFREGDGWAFVAFSPEEISTFLHSHAIAAERVSKLYFAQQSAENFTVPVSLDENEALANINGTATVVPKILLSPDTDYQDFDAKFRPSEGKSFGAGLSSLIGEKDSWVITAIFVMFALMFVVEGFRYKHTISSMEKKVDTLLANYPSLQSRYARENIAQKYRKIDEEERSKREILKSLSRLMLPGVELEALHMEGKKYSAMLKCPDEKSVTRVLALTKEKKFKASRIGSNNIVKIEGNM